MATEAEDTFAAFMAACRALHPAFGRWAERENARLMKSGERAEVRLSILRDELDHMIALWDQDQAAYNAADQLTP